MNFRKLGKQASIIFAAIAISSICNSSVQAQTAIDSPFKQPPIPTNAQEEESSAKIPGHVEATTPAKAAQSPPVNHLLDPANPLGLTSAENSISKVSDLIQKKKIADAQLIIEPLAQWLSDATEFMLIYTRL